MPVKYFIHIFFHRKCFFSCWGYQYLHLFFNFLYSLKNQWFVFLLPFNALAGPLPLPEFTIKSNRAFCVEEKLRNAIYSFYFSPTSISPTYHQRTNTLLVEMLTLEALFHFHWAMKISQLCPEHITSWKSLYVSPLTSLQFLFTIISVVFIIIILSFLASKL